MNALPVFAQFKELDAFFSQKPLDAETVRQEKLAAFAETGEYYVRARLVHGTHIQVINREWLAQQNAADAAGRDADADHSAQSAGRSPYMEVPETDGLITDVPGVALTTTHGDCLPVFAYDPVKGVIGLAHAGWKGTLHNIAGALVETMRQAYGCRSADLYAWVGPGIGRCHFEVHGDVERPFREAGYSPYIFSGNGAFPKEETFFIDLKEINRSQLEAAGAGHIEVSPHCTVCEGDLYYSHRRGGDTQRMLAYIQKRV